MSISDQFFSNMDSEQESAGAITVHSVVAPSGEHLRGEAGMVCLQCKNWS